DEEAEELLLAVEVQSADRLPGDVVQQHTEVRLGDTSKNAFNRNLTNRDCTDDVVPLDFFQHYHQITAPLTGVVTVYDHPVDGSVCDRSCGDGRPLPLEGSLQPLVDLVGDPLPTCLPRDTREELAHLGREWAVIDTRGEDPYELVTRA